MFLTFGIAAVPLSVILAMASAAGEHPAIPATAGGDPIGTRRETLEALAQEVIRLNQELRTLRDENGRLRQELSDLRGTADGEAGTAGRVPSPAERRERLRFMDHGEYVQDLRTGLLWQKDGDASGERNFYQAVEYATKLNLGGVAGWRVPTRVELATIFPAVQLPFADTKYNPRPYAAGRGGWHSYWTSDLDTRRPDYAFIYHWYADGGANNCSASVNRGYVRCVHDPVTSIPAPKPAARARKRARSTPAVPSAEQDSTRIEPRTLRSRSVAAHPRTIWQMAVSADGRYLATAAGTSRSSTVRVWAVESGEQVVQLPEYDHFVHALALAPDGRRLATAISTGAIDLWEVPAGRRTGILESHTRGALSLAFFPHGDRLASASPDGTARIWELANPETPETIHRQSAPLRAVAVSPDGRLLALGGDAHAVGESGVFIVWDTENGEPRWRRELERGVSSLAFSPDGRTLGVCVINAWQGIRRFDTATGEPRPDLEGHHFGGADVAWAPDGKLLAGAYIASGPKISLVLWNALTGRELPVHFEANPGARDIAFTPDGKTLISVGAQGEIHFWPLETIAAELP